jgi:hypothetical protein
MAAGSEPQSELLVLEQEDFSVADRVGGDDEAVALQDECSETNLRWAAMLRISAAAAGFS